MYKANSIQFTAGVRYEMTCSYKYQVAIFSSTFFTHQHHPCNPLLNGQILILFIDMTMLLSLTRTQTALELVVQCQHFVILMMPMPTPLSLLLSWHVLSYQLVVIHLVFLGQWFDRSLAYTYRIIHIIIELAWMLSAM